MTKVRTLISLTAVERMRLQRRARADGVSVAEVVRRAVDQYLTELATQQQGQDDPEETEVVSR